MEKTGKGKADMVPLHFLPKVRVPPLFTSCHSCGTTRILQCFPDSLARFVEEERVRKGKGNGEDREGGRQIWYFTFFAQNDANDGINVCRNYKDG